MAIWKDIRNGRIEMYKNRVGRSTAKQISSFTMQLERTTRLASSHDRVEIDSHVT